MVNHPGGIRQCLLDYRGAGVGKVHPHEVLIRYTSSQGNDESNQRLTARGDLELFFWHSGTKLQKSMEGLLRTLTREAIIAGDVDDAILQTACPSQWQNCLYDQSPANEWPIDDLETLFADIMASLAKSNKVVIFVDGLDEYGADRQEREDLVEFLQGVARCTPVKMCLSSRPWNEFKDWFEPNPHESLESYPHLRMGRYQQERYEGLRRGRIIWAPRLPRFCKDR